MINKLQTLLEEWNHQQIRYALIRNYEFLLDAHEPPGFDLDIVVAEEDYLRIESVLISHGFIKYPQQFSLRHQGFGKYFPQSQKKIGLDIQVGGIHWNDIPYLAAEQVLPRRVFREFFYTLSEEDELVMYICHSLLGKRYFKEKYKQKITELLQKDTNIVNVQKNLTTIFNQPISQRLITAIQLGDFSALEKKSYRYATYYVIKNKKNIFQFIKLSVRWFWQKGLLRNYPLISFIGPDGSGKTWNAEQLRRVLVENNRNAVVIYTGRGKGNILPIKKIAGIYKRTEEKTTDKKNKLVYILAAPVYTIDLLFRYFFRIVPKRMEKKIVITDRYGSDVLLMKHVPLWFKKVLFSLFPKPTLAFYLYNDPEVLYERRKQQSPEELQRQMELFGHLVKKFQALPIKTNDPEQDSQMIAQRTFTYLFQNRY